MWRHVPGKTTRIPGVPSSSPSQQHLGLLKVQQPHHHATPMSAAALEVIPSGGMQPLARRQQGSVDRGSPSPTPSGKNDNDEAALLRWRMSPSPSPTCDVVKVVKRLPTHIRAPQKSFQSLITIVKYLSAVIKYLNKYPSILEADLALDCEEAVCVALTAATQRLTQTALPENLSDVEALTQLLGPSDSATSDDKSDEDEDEFMNMDEDPGEEEGEGEEEEDSSTGDGSGARDGFGKISNQETIVFLAGQILAQLNHQITPVGATTVLITVQALNGTFPESSGPRTLYVNGAIRQWMLSLEDCVLRSQKVYARLKPYEALSPSMPKSSFIDVAESQGLIASLMLALQHCRLRGIGYFVRRKRVLNQLSLYCCAQLPSQTSAQAAATYTATMQCMSHATLTATELIRQFGKVMAKAAHPVASKSGSGKNKAGRAELQLEQWSPTELLEVMLERTPSLHYSAMLSTIKDVILKLGTPTAVMALAMTLSHVRGEDDWIADDDNQEDLMKFQTHTVAALASKTAGREDMSLDPYQLINLAVIVSDLILRVKGDITHDINMANDFLIRICRNVERLLDKPATFDGAMGVEQLVVLARVLISTEDVHNNTRLLRTVMDSVARRARELSGDMLADCLYRLVENKKPYGGHISTLFNSINREATGKRHDMSLSALLRYLYALAFLEPQGDMAVNGQRSMSSICDLLVEKLGKGTFSHATDVNMAANVFSKHKYHHEQLLSKLCEAASTHLLDVLNSPKTSSDLDQHGQAMSSMITVAFTVAHINPKAPKAQRMFRDVGEALASRLHTLRDCDITLLCWAYAVADENPKVATSRSWLRARSEILSHKANHHGDHREKGDGRHSKRKPHATCMYMADMLMCELHARVDTLRQTRRPVLGRAKFAVQIWEALEAVKVPEAVSTLLFFRNPVSTSSKSQKEVHELLEHSTPALRGVTSEAPVGDGHGGWMVDTRALHKRTGREVYIEVDGPDHYASNDHTWLLGATRARNKCLLKMLADHDPCGALVTLNLRDLPSTDVQRKQFIADRIDAAIKVAEATPSTKAKGRGTRMSMKLFSEMSAQHQRREVLKTRSGRNAPSRNGNRQVGTAPVPGPRSSPGPRPSRPGPKQLTSSSPTSDCDDVDREED